MITHLASLSRERRKQLVNIVYLSVCGFLALGTTGVVALRSHNLAKTVMECSAVTHRDTLYTLKWSDRAMGPVTIIERPRAPSRSIGAYGGYYNPGSSRLVVLYQGERHEFAGPVEIVRLDDQPASVTNAERELDRAYQSMAGSGAILWWGIVALVVGCLLSVLLGWLYTSGRILPYVERDDLAALRARILGGR